MLSQDPLVDLLQRMALAGLEGDFLLVHGLGVQLGERVGRAAEGGVERPIHLVKARRVRFPLPRHGFDEKNDRRRNPKNGGEGGGGIGETSQAPFSLSLPPL